MTPWERCIITQFLRSLSDTTPVKLTWVDWFIPLSLFAFLLAVAAFVYHFPNGVF